MHSDQTRVGGRVRARRAARGLTIKALAERSGLSARYISLSEQGAANLSLGKLRQLADALDVSITWLVSDGARGALDAVLVERTDAELSEITAWVRRRFEFADPLIALLGLRGAGKSAVGARLAARLERPFVELDSRIATVADLSLADIFSVHGEAYYRRLETEVLDALIAEGRPAVIATGGSIVTHPQNFEKLREATTTVWLRARPEDHWDRVIQQGDRRPMRDHPHAMAELRALLEARVPLYARADVRVDTSDVPLDTVVDRVADALCSDP